MATPLESYIRQAAMARGIDPDIAVRVAKSEGGLSDPTRQSDVVTRGRREPSYGPFQMLVGGGNTGFPEGLGNRALAAGIDPRNPADAYRTIDFALDQAKQGGWTPWYGAKNSGIGRWAGINGQASSTNPPERLGGDSLVPRDHSAQIAGQTNAPLLGTMAPQGAMAPQMVGSPLPPEVAQYAASEEPKSFGDRLSETAKSWNEQLPKPPRLGPMQGPGNTGNALLEFMNSPTAADMFLKKRLSGVA